ncbi:ethanolamine ammonia-lyase subunit EutC [Reichenbachiella ulvae]|uniref:Ethanolamine ammonia-lyase small subunit n=1 Tax=Reichenbachiella ulvae TaxID=2980104 RepID=A0ABT3CXZ5_9BACT|nr:ethanolamine ammonia-lyase subunit EutC [Reichenbachiella ulvae]MCV9388434.1 ethanolamine ammonia-lyase subunit EutC [Reichenbachiella ulvae]
MSNGDAWEKYRNFTNARIALGRTGGSLTTSEMLSFRMDHALARDAVWSEVDWESMQSVLTPLNQPMHLLKSQAGNRQQYIQRPDLGRLLHPDSQSSLKEQSITETEVAIVISDGLSAMAIESHVLPFLSALLPLLSSFRLAPLMLVENGRVAIGDPIGELCKCQITVVLVGERPGLSSPDSLGAYLTFDPKTGNTDEKRNCISNIRAEGLSYDYAAQKLAFLISEALRRKISGVNLKDTFDDQLLDSDFAKDVKSNKIRHIQKP